MRKLVVSEFVSLDGVIENPAWTFPYWNDEIAAFKGAETESTDSLLLGRVTYEGFAAAWPESKDEGAAWMNAVPKAVVTATLDSLTWQNASVLRGDLATEVQKIKQQPGRNILLYGSGMLVQALMDLDLIDQYNLLYYPVVLGKGQKLFEEGREAKLKLVETKPFSSGVVGLIYVPDRESA